MMAGRGDNPKNSPGHPHHKFPIDDKSESQTHFNQISQGFNDITHNNINSLKFSDSENVIKGDQNVVMDTSNTEMATSSDFKCEFGSKISNLTTNFPSSGGFSVLKSADDAQSKNSVWSVSSNSFDSLVAQNKRAIDLASYNDFYSNCNSNNPAKSHSTISNNFSNSFSCQDRQMSTGASNPTPHINGGQNSTLESQSKLMSGNGTFFSSNNNSFRTGIKDIVESKESLMAASSNFSLGFERPGYSLRTSLSFGTPKNQSISTRHFQSFQNQLGTDTGEFEPQKTPNTSIDVLLESGDDNLNHDSPVQCATNAEDQEQKLDLNMYQTMPEESVEGKEMIENGEGKKPLPLLAREPMLHPSHHFPNDRVAFEKETVQRDHGKQTDDILLHADFNKTNVLHGEPNMLVDMESSQSHLNAQTESSVKAHQKEQESVKEIPIDIKGKRKSQVAIDKLNDDGAHQIYCDVQMNEFPSDLDQTECKHVQDGFNGDDDLSSLEIGTDKESIHDNVSDQQTKESLSSSYGSFPKYEDHGAYGKQCDFKMSSSASGAKCKNKKIFDALANTIADMNRYRNCSSSDNVPSTNGNGSSQENSSTAQSNHTEGSNETDNTQRKTPFRNSSSVSIMIDGRKRNEERMRMNEDGDYEIYAHSEALTIYDGLSGERIMFSALMCVAPEDIQMFGLSFLDQLKSWGFLVFLPERDLILTGPYHENLARVIKERCNGKVIVIVSVNYPSSQECLFLTYFARQLDPVAKKRSIIPIYIDKNIPDLPNVLLGLSSIRYNEAVKNKFLEQKIASALNSDTSGILGVL